MPERRSTGMRLAGAAIVILGLIGLALLSSCGQRGPLYLPDRNARVVTRPAANSAPPDSAPDSAPKSKS